MNYAIDKVHYRRKIYYRKMILLPILKENICKGYILQIKTADVIYINKIGPVDLSKNAMVE